MPAPTAVPLVLRDGDRARLTEVAASDASIAVRARIVLLAAAGTGNSTIAATLGVSRPTVVTWRNRYVAGGLPALGDRERAGRRRRLDDRAIVTATLEPPPRMLRATHWSARLLGQQLGVGHSTVARAWQAYGVRPHGTETYRFATSPEMVVHVADVIGIALTPEARILALRVHPTERQGRHVQRAAALATGVGPIEMYVALRAVLDDPAAHAQHSAADLGRFLQVVERAHLTAAQRGPTLALVVADPATLDRPEVAPWIAAHPRVARHHVPGLAAWLDLVEVCLTIVEHPATQRGAEGCVPELDELLRGVAQGEGGLRTPFVWTSRIRGVRG
ncbi:helix-turn-helix domain-containing protein [Nocardioides sp. W7]|uniref:helix-turn-helix domain-containing protein n=1 Tax=Nocardioides sp. W7 TaxID=2931390 RepID=UPI001FD5A7D6|nr:helix-turn-helix domain-containing protein [Nocardioides sp. W7]